MKERNYNWFPDTEHRFFLCDPSEGEFKYFKTLEERDAAAQDMIDLHCDDGWSEEVDQIIAGEITHHTIAHNVNACPKREDFDSDEDYESAESEYGNTDYPYRCSYKLAPLDEKGEAIPTQTKDPA